jgi:hypothetical protein
MIRFSGKKTILLNNSFLVSYPLILIPLRYRHQRKRKDRSLERHWRRVLSILSVQRESRDHGSSQPYLYHAQVILFEHGYQGSLCNCRNHETTRHESTYVRILIYFFVSVSSCRVPNKVFSIAGTKDRRGVTTQWVTGHKVKAERLITLNNGLRNMAMSRRV